MKQHFRLAVLAASALVLSVAGTAEAKTCEDTCYQIYNQCLDSGTDPLICESDLDDCLAGCPA